MNVPPELQLRHFLLAVCVFLIGCSEVPRITFEIELTTDDNPHKVELYYRAKEPNDGRSHRLYGLKFPQQYYAYRDNHDSLKQSTIGLLLEKKTFKPITQVISAETGIIETISTPRWREGNLKRLAWSKYDDRKIMVLLKGNVPTLKVPVQKLRKIYSRVYDFGGESDGIAFYRVRHPPNFPDGGLPELHAYNLKYPALAYYCASSVTRCSVTFPYRGGAAIFSLHRNQLGEAHDFAMRINRLLDHHVV